MTQTVQERKSIESNIEKFLKSSDELARSLEELKNMVKEKGYDDIQKQIGENNFTNTSSIIENIEMFTKKELMTNVEEVCGIARSIEDDGLVGKIDPKTGIRKGGVRKEPLSGLNEQIFNNIFYHGSARAEDILDSPDQESIDSLNDTLKALSDDGKIKLDKYSYAGKEGYAFDLQPTFSKQLEQNEGEKRVESKLTKLKRKYQNNLSLAFFVEDAASFLENKGYTIENKSPQNIEAKSNVKTHFTPLLSKDGSIDKEKVFNTLTNKNQLKKIGFICETEGIKEEIEGYNLEWSAEHPDLSEYMEVTIFSIT